MRMEQTQHDQQHDQLSPLLTDLCQMQPLFTDLCEICHKKIRLSAIKCKCKRKLCKNHVFPQNHDCDFDYKSEGKLILEKNLVSVHSRKLMKYDPG